MPTLYRSYVDAELMALLKQGDLDAFTEVYKRYYSILYRHAYRRLPDREEVNDILQELFTCIWNNRENIDLKTGLQAYLCTAIRNRILNVYKHDKIKAGYVASFQIYLNNLDEPIADEALRIKELVALINAEVAALPPKMRQIFEMSRNENLSHHEIAEKLNLSILTVRKQVQNSIKILRVKLGTFLFSVFL